MYQRLQDDGADSTAGDSTLPSLEGERAGSRSRELFEEDSAQQLASGAHKPWWKANFFIRGPVLFGTWDGVFTTVMINIFGVLIFLRMGWMIGYAGVGIASLIILLTIVLGVVTIMSVISLIKRQVKHTEMHQASGAGMDNMATYDVFSMIGFVLGERISGSVGIVYAFGHAVAVAMYAVGLGEAMSDLFHWHGVWPIRGVALGTTFVLMLVVLSGVRWVVKLQLILMLILTVAISDFTIGTLVRHSPSNGVLGYSASLLHNNTPPAFTRDVTFFNVFGVFFPTMTGVAGGLNMACDLKTPGRSVPVGTASALVVSGVSWIAMAIMLGATCTAHALQTDTLIEYRVSLVGALFLIGLYVSSLSSCLAVFYGAPRVLQAMGRAKIVPLLSVIGVGHGPNKEPLIAIVVVGLVAFVFVFVGHLNTLAVLINMPFLLTYSVLNYAAFSLAQSDDGIACVSDSKRPLNRLGSLYRGRSASSTASSHETESIDDTTAAGDDPAENHSPGEKSQPDDSPPVNRVHFTEKDRLISDPIPAKSTSEESVFGDTSSGLRHRSAAQGKVRRFPRLRRLQERLGMLEEDRVRREETAVRFLNRMANRWLSLLGFFMCLIAMFVIHWGFALAAVCSVLILFIYIGHANPSLGGGETSFSLALWIPQIARRLQGCCRRSDPGKAGDGKAAQFPPVERSVIVTQPKVPFDLSVVQLTVESTDYSRRERVHHSVQQTRPSDEFTAPP